MSLKAQIIKALKTKYKNLGFKDKTFDAVATYLDGTVTEEEKIDETITGVEGLLKAFQGDADSRVTEAVAKGGKDKDDKEKKGEDDDKTKTPTTSNEEVPTWAQGLIKANETLLLEINALKAGKTTESRQATLETLLKETPEKFRELTLKNFTRMTFKDDAEFEAYKTELESGLEGMKDVFAGAQGLDKLPSPPFSGTKTKNGISADTEAYINHKKAEVEGKSQVMGKQIFQT